MEGGGAQQIDLDPTFKIALVIVLGIVLLSLLIMAVLAILGAHNTDSGKLFTLCSDVFKLGFGAIVGLLGGKKL
ncbi:MAG: hypothetical protein ACRD4E_03430 [Bryobacteraceae bacterium]